MSLLFRSAITAIEPHAGVTEPRADGRIRTIPSGFGAAGTAFLLGGVAATCRFATLFDSAAAVGARSADLNGDLHADLISSNFSAKRVSIFLVAGDGKLSESSRLSFDDYVGRVAVGDLNGDQALDLVVPEDATNRVAVLLGAGDGTFGTPTTFPIGTNFGSHPNWAALGDFDGDLDLDLACASWRSGQLWVAPGNGDGTFGAATRLTTSTDWLDLVVADINEDQRLDLVLLRESPANGSGQALFMLGNGNLTFQAATIVDVGGSSRALAVADMNGDHHVDIVSANVFKVAVVKGDGLGTFAAPIVFSTPGDRSQGLALGDLNQDSRPDIVTVNYTTSPWDTATVYLNNGDDTYASTSVILGDDPSSAAMADVNGDGLLDVVTASDGEFALTALLNLGGGAFASQRQFDVPGLAGLFTADVNGDRHDDLIALRGDQTALEVFVNDGYGNFPTGLLTSAIPSADEPQCAAAGDFNGDGKLDLVATNIPGSDVWVWLGNGDGAFPDAPSNVAAGATAWTVYVADVNADRKLDIVTANPSAAPPSVSVILGNGDGTFKSPQKFAMGASSYNLAVGDVNSDGKVDIFVGNNPILLGNGAGNFTAGPTLTTRFAERRLVDFNGDGKLDLGHLVHL